MKAGDLIFLLVLVFILLCVNCILFKWIVDVAKVEDAQDLGSCVHCEHTGSSPVIDMKGVEMKKEWKHYENAEGKLVIAYYGLSRPMNENDPFLYGYWTSLDLHGSEKFTPKLEFEKEFHEVKKPK